MKITKRNNETKFFSDNETKRNNGIFSVIFCFVTLWRSCPAEAQLHHLLPSPPASALSSVFRHRLPMVKPGKRNSAIPVWVGVPRSGGRWKMRCASVWVEADVPLSADALQYVFPSCPDWMQQTLVKSLMTSCKPRNRTKSLHMWMKCKICAFVKWEIVSVGAAS